jgi:hypothetical protein
LHLRDHVRLREIRGTLHEIYVSSTGHEGMRRARREPRELVRLPRQPPLALGPWLSAAMITGASWASVARAQELDDLTLRWHAPATCPDRTAVLARIRAHLPQEHRSARPWSVEGRVVNQGARYHLELDMQSDESLAQRAIDNESCAALAEAAALLVALALDPEAAAARDAETAPANADEARMPEPDPTASAAASTPARPAASGGGAASEERTPSSPRAVEVAEDRSDTEAPDTPSAKIDLGWDFGAALQLDSGMLPQTPAVGLQPQLGVSLGRVSVRLGITLWFAARTSSDSYPSATLEGRGLLGNAGFCVELLSGPVTLAPCAVGEFGELVLESHGISSPGLSEAGWSAAGGGLRTGYLVAGGLRVTLDAHVLAPFRRPRWLVRTMQGGVPLFATAPATIRLAIGLSYAFEWLL